MLLQEGLSPTQRPAARPGPAVRALARLRSLSLDELISAGADPARSALLAARATQLTSRRSRERLARALLGLPIAAEHGPRVSRIRPDATAVARNRAALRELAARLESPVPVYAPGMARVLRLLSDPSGPVFEGGADELEQELVRAAAELDGAAARDGAASSPRLRGRRRPARLARLRPPGSAPPAPPGFVGGSFTLPDGSWFHGRRDSA